MSDTSTLKTVLNNSLPSSISLSVGNTAQYVYLVVKSSLSINTLKSGGFDVPYQLLDTVTFTNHFDATYEVKIYRTVNKVVGDLNFNINQ